MIENPNFAKRLFNEVALVYQKQFIGLDSRSLPPKVCLKLKTNLARAAINHLKTYSGYEDLSGIKLGEQVYRQDGSITTLEEIKDLNLTLVDFTPLEETNP